MEAFGRYRFTRLFLGGMILWLILQSVVNIGVDLGDHKRCLQLMLLRRAEAGVRRLVGSTHVQGMDATSHPCVRWKRAMGIFGKELESHYCGIGIAGVYFPPKM